MEDTSTEILKDATSEGLKDTITESIKDTGTESIKDTSAESIKDTTSESEEDTSTESPLPRNVTTIIKDLSPKLEAYLDKLLKFLPVYVRQVHESSTYEPLVFQIEAWRHMGVFYDYLIRKEIHNLMGEEAIDHRASTFEKMLASYNRLVDGIKSKRVVLETAGVDVEPRDDDHVKALANAIFPYNIKPYLKPVASYQKYKDPKNASLDIIEDIFNTSMLHLHYFSESVIPFDPKLLNMDNVKSVLKYVASFDRNKILLNPDVGCEYFNADADLILDDILMEIKVSMHYFRIKHIVSRRHLYQMILYALGVFVNEGKEIRKFKIYNPLKGIEYYFEIAQLDFNEFLKLVQEIKPL